MKTTLIEKTDDIAKFSIEFSDEEFENAQNEVYRNTRSKFTVAGFRKGKAPRKLIENHFGEEIFFEDAANKLINSGYSNALLELGLDPVDDPELDIGELSKGSGFTLTVSVQVKPQVKLNEYKGVEVKRPDNKISDMDVDNEIEKVRKRNVRLVSANRAAVEDDTLIIDFAGFVDEKQFEGGTAERYSLKLGAGMFIPGFEEQLTGAKPGDEVDVKVVFPEDYHSKELAGKDAVFHVKVHEVKAEELPVVDDEFAQEASEFDSLEEWKDSVRSKLEASVTAQNEYDLKEAVLQKVYDSHDVEAPDIMVERELDYEMELIGQRLQADSLSLEAYLKYMKKDESEMREELRPKAERKVKMRLLVRAVAEAESIQATDEEIEKEIAAMAAMYNQELEKFRKTLGSSNLTLIKEDIRFAKAVDFLVDSAVVID